MARPPCLTEALSMLATRGYDPMVPEFSFSRCMFQGWAVIVYTRPMFVEADGTLHEVDSEGESYMLTETFHFDAHELESAILVHKNIRRTHLSTVNVEFSMRVSHFWRHSDEDRMILLHKM